MNDMMYFINNFVQKHRRERWLYLLNRGWKKFFDNISQMEAHLNEKCRYERLNGVERVREVIKDDGLKSGVYYDRHQADEDYDHIVNLRDIDQIGLSDFSFIVCGKHERAFYFNNESGVWICKG